MDVEHLNRTQIILLTLLVSFVTSIATGIVTVSLLDQAPKEVTQTINRVVERTVERVVPEVGKQVATVKETTLVVKEEDLITSSIEKNRTALVRIVAASLALPDLPAEVVAVGVAADKNGTVATARAIFAEGFSYTALLPSGETATLKVLNATSTSSVALLALGKTDALSPGAFAGGVPKLGQSAIALSGASRTSVATGIISGLLMGEVATTTLAFIQANIAPADALPGSPLLNIFGEVVGIRAVTTPASGTLYIPSAAIAEELAGLAVTPARQP